MQVSQELLHLVYGDLPGIEQDRGYRMAEQMRVDPLGDASLARALLHHGLHRPDLGVHQ